MSKPKYEEKEMNKSKKAQLIKYGGEAGYSAEMKRRQSLRKTKYRHFDDPEKASEAARKRHGVKIPDSNTILVPKYEEKPSSKVG